MHVNPVPPIPPPALGDVAEAVAEMDFQAWTHIIAHISAAAAAEFDREVLASILTLDAERLQELIADTERGS